MKKLLALIFCLISFSFVQVFASDAPANPPAQTEEAKYQVLLDEYKAYLATVSAEIRKEIESYRGQISDLNKKKKEVYTKLSQEAQKFLAKEREYKKKISGKKDWKKDQTSDESKK